MRNDRAYLLYKLVPSTRPGKMDKIPLSPYTLDACAANDPANFADYDACAAMVLAGLADGVAWSVQPGYYFLDVDGSTANPLTVDLTGAHYEVSSSGKGCHFIGRYSGPRPSHRCKVPVAGADLELYTADRFVALTTEPPESLPDTTSALLALVGGTFAPKAHLSATEWTDGPCDGWSGPEDDDELIAKMLSRRDSAAAAFGGRATLSDLWHANADKLGSSYPDSSGDRPYDGNAADQALATHLAFWTGNDCERIWRLIQRSALMRDKWLRDDYRERTILNATGMTQTVLGKTAAPDLPALAVPVAPSVVPTLVPEVKEGFQFVNAQGQLDLFKKCCYVTDEHKVWLPNGELLKPEQFKARFGGYVFAMDASNTKVTNDAWQAFTQSQVVRYPIADRATFRPDLPTGAVFEDEGLMYVNTFVPAPVRRVAGDAAPFLVHLAKMFPVQRDRDILLAYMAAVVQYPGVKFQWAPLVQGVKGNGKSMLISCLMRAVGKRYSFKPQAHDIDNKFNAWLVGKLFCGVEEIYVPGHKIDIMEVLKEMITGNEGVGIQGKGKDQSSKDICCNFLFNSNYKDALKIDNSERRYAPFYCAQQETSDLIRDGMGGDYMPDLWHWLKMQDGFAIVADYLHTYAIPKELNPAGAMHRAPHTSSTREAVVMSLGMVEQEIIEAVEEGRPGFCGGWISSVAIDRLLDTIRASRIVPRSKRKDLMHSLGYVLHPALKDGRMTSASTVDGGAKPRLYIKADHIHGQLTQPAAVAQHYLTAQQQGALQATFGVA